MTFYNQHSTALVGSGAENNQGGYTIERSLRFRSSASAYLSRTPASASNAQKFTISFWMKYSSIGSDKTIFSTNNGGTAGFRVATLGGGQSGFSVDQVNGSNNLDFRLYTTMSLRDPSAWYHCIISFDTTQATASNRIKMYINGVQVTSFITETYPSQNFNTYVNASTNPVNIGRTSNGTGYFEGYLTEFNFVDGQQLDPSYFGETDVVTGVWKPKAYGDTYGTNGFYLNFSDNTSTTTLGYDQSSNSNNWTTNNISLTAGSTYDSMTDVPTLTDADAGNFCTLNPLQNGGLTITNGNLTWAGAGSSVKCATGSIAMTSGKWYFEALITGSSSGNWYSGVCNLSPTLTSAPSATATGWGLLTGGGGTVLYKSNNNNLTSLSSSSVTGSVVGFAIDVDAGKIWFAQNGNWLEGSPSAGTGASYTNLTGTQIPYVAGYDSNDKGSVNFGQRPFSYTPPTGYKALNTYNLPDPTIKDGSKHFDVRLWSADVSNPAAGDKPILLDFQPDLVWSKNRDNAESHYWMDSVRGNAGNKWLRSSSTAAEGGAAAVGATDCYYDFNSSGFDIIDTNSNYDEIYYNGRTYVGWCWKGGNTSGVSNTDGSITSTVSANTTSGFSIVTYTGIGGNGTGTTGSIGHGLGTTPAMLIVKARNYAWKWVVYHKDATPNNNQHLQLQSTANVTTSAYNFWDTSNLNSSTFGVGEQSDTNFNGANFVAYCFAPIEGYSAFGKYTGTGSTDGTFVYTGFRPAFVMMKRISVSGNWTIKDNSRPSYNSATGTLFAEDASVELTGYPVDFVSNGFKHRNAGYPNSAEQYIYMAFAENPFKYSLAR